MPPRTARRKKAKTKADSSDDHEEEERKQEEEVEEDDRVVIEVEDDSDYKEKTKRKRKKKNDDSEKPKKKNKKSSASSSSNVEEEEAEEPKKKKSKKKDKTDEEEEANDKSTPLDENTEQYDMMDVKEEEVEVSLDSIKFDNEFTMQAVNHVKESIAFLDSVELNYPSLPSAERQGIITILKHLQNKVAKLGDLCKSAELLLFRGKNHDMSEYGLLNTVQLPEIWSTVFSFLDFSDFLKASQVCKTWHTASLHPCALSCFNLDFDADYSVLHFVEIYKKYISWRLENIYTVWDIPQRLIKWFASSGVVFPNAKYRDAKYRVAWDDSSIETNDSDIAQVFPKINKSIFEPEFISLWGFLDIRSSSKKTIPTGTNIAKLFDKHVEFEDPASIEELVILKVDESKLPEFENLKRLDLSLLLRMKETEDMTYCFKSKKLTKLCVTYSVFFDEMLPVVANLENIKSLKLVDSASYRKGCTIVSELNRFKNLIELEMETLNESDLIQFPSTIRKLKIGKITEKNAKIFPLLVNIEELHTTEQVLSHINLIRLPNLKTLLVYNNSSNHNKQVTIESSTLENICLLTYNSITIKCPNLYDLRLGPGLKGGSDSVYIKSNQLTNFTLERDIQMLSIQGPNFVADGTILDRVKNIVDLECPLIDKAYVNSLSSINQGDSFRTLLTKQIKTLTISVSYFELFNTKTEIQRLTITNWKSNQTISAAKMNIYRQNVHNYKTLEIINCSVDVVNLLNSIFKDSTSLESLRIQDTSYDTEYFDSLSDPTYYPNMKSLSLCNISSLKPQTGTKFLKGCDKRPLLTRIELQYRSSYKKKFGTYIPIHCTSYIGQLSGCVNTSALPNLTHLTITSGGMSFIDYSAFNYFPNLKFLHFSQLSYLDSSMAGSEKILDYCKNLETVISLFNVPKEFHEKKEITVVENV